MSTPDLSNGTYRTGHGSTVNVSGDSSGRFTCVFNWFEEPNACLDCRIDLPPQPDGNRWFLQWSCDHCGGGRAELIKVVVS